MAEDVKLANLTGFIRCLKFRSESMTESYRRSGLSQRSSGNSGKTSFWAIAQFTSPFLFAGYIAFAIWGGYKPDLASGEDVFNHLLACATIAFVYLAIQGFAVVLLPVGSDVRPLLDVLTSLVPILVIALAVERSFFGALQLSHYEVGLLWLSGLAAFIDLTCFTLFAMKVNRLAPDVVVTS